MRLNIVIGGRAGQGINLVSKIVSSVLTQQGYFTFNYRDYPSIIRGGHNFNVLSISDEKIESHESTIDGIVAMDDLTMEVHKKELKKSGFIIKPDSFLEFGINLNVALAAALMKILGIKKDVLNDEIKQSIKKNVEDALKASDAGYASETTKIQLPAPHPNKIRIISGSEAIAEGAANSHIDAYIAYPMTPSTAVLQILASQQEKLGHIVFQPEGEIAVVNSALAVSFAGARTMIGTSGGGFALMNEGISLQGQSEVPLVVYLVSRPGPATGVPTYTSQGDLNLALRAGHGEFPRVVIAPGTPKEAIEKTNEAFYLSEQHGVLSIILSDKHLAESEFSLVEPINKPTKIQIKRKVPGETIIKATSYEHDDIGNTTEDADIAYKNGLKRLKKYEEIKKSCQKFEMIKIHGKKDSKNLIIGWGSTAGAIKDAIKDLDAKFLQVLYIKPLSSEIKKHIEESSNVLLIENNLTGQLGRLIREKTGISVKKRILKFDARPFHSDILKQQIIKELIS
ncbi:MAG: 2-oxoacid:acceptor oxidoreductase family protein [Nanoarchaeota archaeon]|nr:2-oxoacid:acceptor oxidoreductase family protein [Nanoarchaeota archaeon]MBU0977277.1 2-oxoacid:acceptor oxidoreductase family protein [Nanoarchaeota archaeon]